MDYITVAEARELPGLRLVLTTGVPGPWGESAKAILDYKGLAYVAVAQEAGAANEDLLAWTGQSSAPVAIMDSQLPVSHWLDLLHLAERLAPERPLLPADASQRSQVTGLSALVAGVDGFGWQRRLQLLAAGMRSSSPPEVIARMAGKYSWSDAGAESAADQLCAIADCLDQQLAGQQARGCDYLVGDAVTAVDFYWANFAGMVQPLDHEANPMPAYIREAYSSGDALAQGWVTTRLLAHRDMMYQRHLKLPLDY